MYRELAHLLLYSDLGEDAILHVKADCIRLTSKSCLQFGVIIAAYPYK